MRQKSLHRRHMSMGNASYSLDEAQARQRRSSNLSGTRDEAALRYAQRPHSWGPVGTAYYMESLMCAFYEPALLHGPCIGSILLYLLNIFLYYFLLTNKNETMYKDCVQCA